MPARHVTQVERVLTGVGSLQLYEFERDGAQLRHHAQIVRNDDHQVIADVTTRRRLRCEGRGFLETLFRKGRLIDPTPVQPAPSAAAIASAVSASAPS